MVILLFTSWWNLSFTFCDFYTYVSWIKFFFPIETLKVLVYIWYCSNLKCLATNESISIIGSFLITTVPIFSTLIFKDNKGIMYLQTSVVYFPFWNVVLIGFSKFLATVLINCFYFLNFCFIAQIINFLQSQMRLFKSALSILLNFLWRIADFSCSNSLKFQILFSSEWIIFLTKNINWRYSLSVFYTRTSSWATSIVCDVILLLLCISFLFRFLTSRLPFNKLCWYIFNYLLQ